MEIGSTAAMGRRYDNGHQVFTEPTPKRVRVRFGGEWIADSRRALLLHESKHLPVYYFPRGDVRMDLMEGTDHTTRCPYKGEASYWTVRAGGREAENAVWAYPEPIEGKEHLAEYVAFYWNEMDQWFEEDDEVFVHARDPYKRIDVLHSSRHVQVRIGDTLLAETHRPVLLFETGLPVRTYIPQTDVRLDLLAPSDHSTDCPYKGSGAQYWSVNAGGEVHENLVWSYPFPTREALPIAGLVCFFDERVDMTIDGELQERPQTRWSVKGE